LSVYALTQEQITTAARDTFNTASANFDWNTYLNKYLNGEPPGTPQYEAGMLAWGESYVAMVQRAMFDATGDARYVDLLLDSAETMYANRADRLNPALIDEIRNTLMPAFVSYNLNLGANAREHAWLVHAAFPSHPVTYAVSKINSDPQLRSTYGARADALTADIMETMDSFDAEFSLISGGRGVYYEPYLDFYAPVTNGQTPYNMQDAAGSTYVALWKATGEQRFYDRAVALAKTLKAEFTPIGDRYRWRYAPYNPANSASDISHAGLDVNFVIDAYEAGIVFDDSDIQRLANTMRHMQVGPGFTANVDGVGAGSADKTSVAWLWLRLARYDSALREEMYPVFQDYWNSPHAQANPIFPTLGSALLYETGGVYTPEESFDDAFAGSQIDARWRRPLSQPIGNTWKAQASGSQFIVTDIDATPSGDQWVDILRTRDVEQDDSWEVAFEFSWDSADGTADPIEAMQRFFVELRDPVGELIANVGINDAWNLHSGGRVFELFDQKITEPFDSIALAGSASVRITSDALVGESNIFWDDSLLLSVPRAVELAQVGMRFGHFTGLGLASHFGQIAVDSFAVSELIPQLVADFNDDGAVDAADYIVWRATLGASLAPWTGADATGDGLVTLDDYQRWRSDFGMSASSGVTGGVVPEPAGATLVVSMMSMLLAIRRKPRRKFRVFAAFC
jgi:hypothetical protein